MADTLLEVFWDRKSYHGQWFIREKEMQKLGQGQPDAVIS
jgi:hypothetical protein